MRRRELNVAVVGAFVSLVNTNNRKYQIESIQKDANGNVAELTIVTVSGPVQRHSIRPETANELINYKA